MFSVIIPTMQGSSDLWQLLDLFNEHPLVDEILIINNSNTPLDGTIPPKCQIIYEGPNVFVNPAWNLGAERAKSEFLIIANDDIAFNPELLDHISAEIRSMPFGIIGPSAASVYGYDKHDTLRLKRIDEVPGGFGVLMFLRRDQYVPIPETMKIYAGEYWLVWNQPYPSYEISGFRIDTVMHTTSGRAEFNQRKVEDTAAYESAMADVLGSQPWHSRARRQTALRSWRRRFLAPLRSAKKTLTACRLGSRKA